MSLVARGKLRSTLELEGDILTALRALSGFPAELGVICDQVGRPRDKDGVGASRVAYVVRNLAKAGVIAKSGRGRYYLPLGPISGPYGESSYAGGRRVYPTFAGQTQPPEAYLKTINPLPIARKTVRQQIIHFMSNRPLGKRITRLKDITDQTDTHPVYASQIVYELVEEGILDKKGRGEYVYASEKGWEPLTRKRLLTPPGIYERSRIPADAKPMKEEFKRPPKGKTMLMVLNVARPGDVHYSLLAEIAGISLNSAAAFLTKFVADGFVTRLGNGYYQTGPAFPRSLFRSRL